MEDKRAMRFMVSQSWDRARVIFDWSSVPPALPDWEEVLAKLGLGSRH